jgi:hypothetical protein
MSLHALATDMASRGRGPDSMLVHMAPQEVAGLQALAMKHGGSLTINPDTGLPEAGFLSKLLPMIAGFALNTFVPGLGTAIGGALGTSAAVGTGIAVGGLTGLATGSLSKGLMAGLGAYGGAGLSEGLLGAGAATGAGQTIATEAATQAGLEGIQLPADYASLAAKTATPEQLAAARAASTPSDLLATGAKSAATDPMAFAKSNWKPMAAASLPVLEAITTTTGPTSSPMNPGRIREKRWNGQYFEDVANTDAGVYNTSGRSFSDLYRGYNNGGIVALAGGGYTQDQINAALAAELAARPNTPQASLTEYAKSQYGLSDAQINAAYDTLPGFNAQGKYDAADYMATHKPGQVSPQMVVDAAAAANPFSAQNMAKVDTTRPGHYVNDASGNPVALTSYSPGFDINNKTALTYLGELSAGSAPDDAAKWFQQNATAAQKAEADRLWTAEKARLDAIDAANAVKAPTGLANLNQNQNLLVNQNLTNQNANAGLTALADGKSQTYKWFEERGLGFTPIDKVIDNWFDEYTDDLALLPPDRQEKVMKDALNTENMNEADLIKATGKTIKDWIQIKTGNIKDVTSTYLPAGVGGGGNTVRNDNGTITTTPDIPGRPDDGFTGMKNVRDVYTEGGGNLGYTSPSFDKIEDFNKKYVTDRMSGDSLAAYEYLTGKKGAAYPVKSGVGQIARPYDEAVLGYPTRGNLPFTYDKATGKMVRNPDYVAPGRDEKGNVTYGMSLNDIKKALTDTPLSGQALYDWAMTNKLSAQQIADATGRSLSSVYADFRGGAKAKAAVTNADGTIDETKVAEKALADEKEYFDEAAYLAAYPDVKREIETGKSASGQPSQFKTGYEHYLQYGKGSTSHLPKFKPGYTPPVAKAKGGIMGYAMGGMPGYALGGLGNLGGYSDGGRLLKGPGDGVSDSIPATIGRKQQPARLADGEFVVPARIVSELGNGSTDAGARKLYAMMDRVQRARGKTTGKNKVAANSRAEKYLPA